MASKGCWALDMQKPNKGINVPMSEFMDKMGLEKCPVCTKPVEISQGLEVETLCIHMQPEFYKLAEIFDKMAMTPPPTFMAVHPEHHAIIQELLDYDEGRDSEADAESAKE